jgi:hypothetical protein
MKWFLKYAGWQVYAVFLAVLLALGAAWYAQVAGLRADVSTAKADTATAEKNLSDRIAAESTAIADAVTKARDEEQAKLKDQEAKYATLLQSNRDTRTALAGAEQRLRKLATEAAGRESAGRAADSATVASRIEDASANELRPADRVLIGELLQIAGDAKQVAEERNWLADQYITNCERK